MMLESLHHVCYISGFTSSKDFSSILEVASEIVSIDLEISPAMRDFFSLITMCNVRYDALFL